MTRRQCDAASGSDGLVFQSIDLAPSLTAGTVQADEFRMESNAKSIPAARLPSGCTNSRRPPTAIGASWTLGILWPMAPECLRE